MKAGDESEAETALFDVQNGWNRAMASWDAIAVSELYDASAQLFGSRERLYQGPEQIREYYAGFADVRSCRATFRTEAIVQPASDLVVASGFVTFAMQIGADRRSADFRFTFVLRRSAGGWKILAHHASPVPQSSPAD